MVSHKREGEQMGNFKERVKVGHVVFKGSLSKTQIDLLYDEGYRFIVIFYREVHVFREIADAKDFAQCKNFRLEVSDLK